MRLSLITLLAIIGIFVCVAATFIYVKIIPVQPTLIIQPSLTVEQGDPIMVTLAGISSTSTIKSLLFDGKPLEMVIYNSKPTAFIGMDLHKNPGTYAIVATLFDKNNSASSTLTLKQNITVIARPPEEKPFTIPQSLGGNTPEGQANVLSSMVHDNAVLAGLKSDKTSYWSKAFQFPIKNPIVTDIYGYLRQTGSTDIAHKGTDFKAAVGTPVMAINRGVVIFAGDLGIYGNTIAIDHGLGLMSFYMHLSEIDVKKGRTVDIGDVIGKSGQTGYAIGPHLHLTVRIDGISVDPMVFMSFFITF